MTPGLSNDLPVARGVDVHGQVHYLDVEAPGASEPTDLQGLCGRGGLTVARDPDAYLVGCPGCLKLGRWAVRSLPPTEPTPWRPWLARWFRSGDTGMSSTTIAAVLSGSETAIALTSLSTPSDPSDMGRCVRLLDLAALNGEDWRVRMPEVAQRLADWRPLVAWWPELEAAYRHDARVQAEAVRRSSRPPGPSQLPPSRCWFMLSMLQGLGSPYGYAVMPWFPTDTTRT